MKKISIAVIGLGYWGPNLVRNLLKVPHVSAIHGCDIDAGIVKKAGIEFPTLKLSNSVETVLNDATIDAVVIATPLHSHFSLAKKSLLRNKHVLIEKPMTTTTEEAKELLTLAKKQQRVLMVGHTFVYSEAVRQMKKLIDKKSLGHVYYYDSTRINLGLIQKDSNVIWDLAPHDLSIINYLLSEKPLSVQAVGSSFIGKPIEMAHIFIRFTNNISAHIHVSWLSPVKIRSILLGGSKKMVSYNDIEPSEKLKIYDKGVTPQKDTITPFTPAYRSGDIVIPKLKQTEALLTEMEHFVECVRLGKEPITNGKEGMKVIRLLEGIEKAITTQTEVLL